MRKINIRKKRFGKLIAIRPTKKRNSGNNVIWRCECDCGNITFISTNNLRGGYTKSCGCFKSKSFIERFTIHGLCRTLDYKIWVNMKQRCYNKNAKDYKYYGGRGIKVCKRWRKSFIDFLEDMGERSNSKLTLERIDNDGNYCWYNCKWATRKE